MLISFKDLFKILTDIQNQGYQAIIEYAQQHNFKDIRTKNTSRKVESKAKPKSNFLLKYTSLNTLSEKL